MQKNWKCPFCNHFSSLTDERLKVDRFTFDQGNKYGPLVFQTVIEVCANPECKEYSAHSVVGTAKQSQIGNIPGKIIEKWSLRPKSLAKPYPDFIPEVLRNDYSEACAIRDLSPKASATLARRTLQGMIRDFWKTNEKSLFDEIEALENKVDSLVWDAMNGLRKCGNIGAHMEKDINVIIDVDPNEAEALIGLIEMLFEEWYIARNEREQKLKRVIAISQQKDTLKNSQ